MNISSFLIGYQAGKKAGGGSSADVRYVTFKSRDGTVEYGKKAVAYGDDCADPIARGIFATPTEESTAQFHFTHDYWATEPNGATDPNALKSITENRVVYATFISALRYYTITYCDEDGTTVLKTESLAYGATPGYAAEKEGYGFEGWIPELATVTGNASYTAIWAAKLTFANASWSQIAEICAAGQVEDNFKIGDTKNLVLTVDGSAINVPVILAGIKHDDLADGSGKADLSIVCYKSISTIATGAMANEYRWAYSGIRTMCNTGVLYTALPSELAPLVKEVSKVTGNGRSTSNLFITGAAETTADKLWLLSEEEVNFDSTMNNADEGDPYPIFTDNASRVRYNIAGKKTMWLLRSGYTTYAGAMGKVSTDGTKSNGSTATSAGTDRAIVFGFCI